MHRGWLREELRPQVVHALPAELQSCADWEPRPAGSSLASTSVFLQSRPPPGAKGLHSARLCKLLNSSPKASLLLPLQRAVLHGGGTAGQRQPPRGHSPLQHFWVPPCFCSASTSPTASLLQESPCPPPSYDIAFPQIFSSDGGFSPFFLLFFSDLFTSASG